MSNWRGRRAGYRGKEEEEEEEAGCLIEALMDKAGSVQCLSCRDILVGRPPVTGRDCTSLLAASKIPSLVTVHLDPIHTTVTSFYSCSMPSTTASSLLPNSPPCSSSLNILASVSTFLFLICSSISLDFFAATSMMDCGIFANLATFRP